MSDEKIEIVEVKPKRKKKVEPEIGLIEETNPEVPQLLIGMDPEPLEPLQEELSPEPVVKLVEEKAIAPQPSAEVVVRVEGSAGQGSWHGKHNLARQSKSPGAKKYMPVHRQR
jgi:hypothetical protein